MTGAAALSFQEPVEAILNREQQLYAAGSATHDTYVSFIPALQTTIPEGFPLRPETVDWLDRNDRAFGSRHT
jgi:hypothetical protein